MNFDMLQPLEGHLQGVIEMYPLHSLKMTVEGLEHVGVCQVIEQYMRACVGVYSI